ncbi:ABC transporter ATP-binding protein [Glaciecola siphonariae]|uniref:ABC transporter ATP-binding protein n=1 Tax=Glaciecola siphonariae TaxID=521012 RepID=A0ABV9LS82_9ALTE
MNDTVDRQASDPNVLQDMNAEPVIDVHLLNKHFGDKHVVNNLSLKVRRGQICGFLGPNGSGKTTSIRLLCGLLDVDSGHGQVLGHDILAEQRAIKNKVGYMTQRFSFYEDLSIEQNLRFVARLYELKPIKSVIETTLQSLGLTERRHQLAGELSGGWKQRLALAACTMHKPELLMLDEPTAGVDPKARREFWDEIHRLAGNGLTVLVSTHYMDEAERCHVIKYISNGSLKASGSVSEVIANSQLYTFIVSGARLNDAHRMLSAYHQVEQIAAFGMNLHVVGSNLHALKEALDEVVNATQCKAVLGETSLEDVFIQLISSNKKSV